MQFKSYQELVELQSQFTTSFQKRLEELKRELPKTPGDVITARRASIKRAQEALKAAEKSRDSVVKRANATVAQRKEDIARLEKDLAELESRLKRTGVKEYTKEKAPSRAAKKK